jgi:hypothetical protein
MSKALFRLFLVLFIFSVIYPGEYSFAEFSRNTKSEQQQQTVIKKLPPYFSSAKITVHTFVLPYAVYGQLKPSWAGSLNFLAFDFSSIGKTLFLQNKPALIFKLHFARKLLFPFHFFW